MTAAYRLAEWATRIAPDDSDRALAHRSLLDTIAVTLAAREHPIRPVAAELDNVAGQWAALAHVLDFDDLHLPSTTHISTICIPVAIHCAPTDPELAARAYLAGGGVMTRLGMALGWRHYTSGWHATTTTGAIAAAVVSAVAGGLSVEQTAHAITLAVPASGGVQRAFGSDAKCLQVGMAAQAGVQAARLAEAGALTDPRAVDEWICLVGGDPGHLGELTVVPETIPEGLAIKLYPACYALQRPIGAMRASISEPVAAQEVRAIKVRTPRGTVAPLVHHQPRTGLEGKFSLEYAAATALLDAHSGFWSFSDEAVNRPDAQHLIDLTEIVLDDSGGDGLLDGDVQTEVLFCDGRTARGSLADPPGSPAHPPSLEDLGGKFADCLRSVQITDLQQGDVTFASAPTILRTYLP